MRTIIFIAVFFSISNLSFAQKELIEDYSNKFANGDIITSDNATIRGRLAKSTMSYDESIIGVFFKSDKSITTMGDPKMVPINNITKTDGFVWVKFNTENGIIKKGDLVTSSSTPGVGMKATQSGYIIGVALEDAVTGGSSAGASGLVKIRLMVQYIKQ